MMISKLRKFIRTALTRNTNIIKQFTPRHINIIIIIVIIIIIIIIKANISLYTCPRHGSMKGRGGNCPQTVFLSQQIYLAIFNFICD